jgi:RHS repeat-associated protein
MIYADGKLVATNVETVTGAGNVKAATTRYMHYDPLGSIDMITGPRGEVVDRLSYDPFGARRPGDWKADGIVTLESFSNRGFTGHEHIDEIGLIHMNGRVYDAELGRFLSADKYIQAPYNTQSFNRYSYVWNNPLKYTDPSGWMAAFKEERAIQKENYDKTGSAYDESWRDSNNDNYDRGAVQQSNMRRGLKGLESYYSDGKYGGTIESSTLSLPQNGSLTLEGYYVVGGGVTISWDEETLEVISRYGVGFGGGLLYDDDGKPSMHSKKKGNGYIARGAFNASRSLAIGPIGGFVNANATTGNVLSIDGASPTTYDPDKVYIVTLAVLAVLQMELL